MPSKVCTFGVPLKKATDVEILKPLKNLITSKYQSSEQESYIGPINEFAKLRNGAVCRALDYHEASLDVLYRYYDQIVALESKIAASEIQIPFKWKDAFDKGTMFGGRLSLTVSSLSYEKVCVLFNIAALQSQVAANQTADSDTSLKLAAKLFQSAAGIFYYLKDTIRANVQQDPTPDLQPDTLAALSALCLAEAQEIFTIKAISDSLKPALVAKLCAQCGEYYMDTYKCMQKEPVRYVWEKDWIGKVSMKQHGYQALAEFYQSRVCNAEKSVGEEISRLRKGMEEFKCANVIATDDTAFSYDVFACQKALTEAEKDNNFIYHERVPDVHSLNPVSKAVAAKRAVMPEKFSDAPDLFESLVPVSVQQALEQYGIRKEELVNGEISKLREATQLLNSVLASLNLPAAIEDTSGCKLPQSLREKSEKVVQQGGIMSLTFQIEEMPSLLIRNCELLDETERQLKEESESDTRLRTQFDKAWTRTPSEKLNQTFLTNLGKYRSVVANATNADTVIKNKYSNHKEGMELLSQGPDALAASLPSAAAGAASGSSPAVQTLRGLMEEVETLKAERDVIESEIKSSTLDMKHVFLSALAEDGAVNEPVLSIENLGRVYGPLQRQVKESQDQQVVLVSQIQTAHTQFSLVSSGSGSEREAMLKKLAEAFDAFEELTQHLKEGTKFYNDLTELLLAFQTKVGDYCFARKTEKEELLQSLSHSAASQPVSAPPAQPPHHQEAGKAQPPPRPPPPTITPNPYQGAPCTVASSVTAPYPTPLASAPSPGMPYPIAPQGMPLPQGYTYPVYTPMPQGFNPYGAPAQQPAYPAPGGYMPYPPQPPYGYPLQQSQWPHPHPPQG